MKQQQNIVHRLLGWGITGLGTALGGPLGGVVAKTAYNTLADEFGISKVDIESKSPISKMAIKVLDETLIGLDENEPEQLQPRLVKSEAVYLKQIEESMNYTNKKSALLMAEVHSEDDFVKQTRPWIARETMRMTKILIYAGIGMMFMEGVCNMINPFIEKELDFIDLKEIQNMIVMLGGLLGAAWGYCSISSWGRNKKQEALGIKGIPT